MQNLLESAVESSSSRTLGSKETASAMGASPLAGLADLIATTMQIATATTIMAKRIGASEIKFIDIGRAG